MKNRTHNYIEFIYYIVYDITIITMLNTSLINRIDSQSINNITEDYQLISVSHGKRNATAISLVFTVHNHISLIFLTFHVHILT